MLHPDFLSYPASMVNIQGDWNCVTCAPCARAGQEAWWILKAASLLCRPWSRLLSTMTPPSPGQHCCFCFDKLDQLLSFYCIQNSESCRGKAAEKNTGPERAALQSSLPYSSHKVRRNLLCSREGTKFSWRFSSVISLFTEPWPWSSCLYLICTCPHGP